MPLSDVVAVPAFYRWMRDEFPGGKIAAPVVVWAAILAFLVLAGGVIWNGLGNPLTNYVRGVTSSIPLGQTIVTGALVVVFVGALAWLTIRMNRFVRQLNQHRDLIIQITDGAGTQFPRVDTRIDELDERLTARIEKLEARPSGLQRIEPSNDDPPIGTEGVFGPMGNIGVARAISDALRIKNPEK